LFPDRSRNLPTPADTLRPQHLIDTVSMVPRRLGLLVVDDDVLVRTLLDVALRRHGFAVWVAADGPEALQLYARHRHRIDLALLDVYMPGMSGPQVLRALRAVNPTLRGCLMSGARNPYTDAELRGLGVARFFAKPFQLADLVRALARLAEQPGPSADPLACHADAASPPGPERRRAVRYRIARDSLCQPVGPAGGARWLGRLRDISVGGMRVLLERHLDVGTFLVVELPERDGIRRLFAQVVRAAPDSDGRWELGCHFTCRLSDDELRALLIPTPGSN
jgi:CheY-like chemotaxis protein